MHVYLVAYQALFAFLQDESTSDPDQLIYCLKRMCSRSNENGEWFHCPAPPEWVKPQPRLLLFCISLGAFAISFRRDLKC